MNKNNIIEVAEALYREKNPKSTMDTPSSAYEIVENWAREWRSSGSKHTLYDWIRINKNTK